MGRARPAAGSKAYKTAADAAEMFVVLEAPAQFEDAAALGATRGARWKYCDAGTKGRRSSASSMTSFLLPAALIRAVE